MIDIILNAVRPYLATVTKEVMQQFIDYDKKINMKIDEQNKTLVIFYTNVNTIFSYHINQALNLV